LNLSAKSDDQDKTYHLKPDRVLRMCEGYR